MVLDYWPLDQHMHYGALDLLKTLVFRAPITVLEVSTPNRILDVPPKSVHKLLLNAPIFYLNGL